MWCCHLLLQGAPDVVSAAGQLAPDHSGTLLYMLAAVFGVHPQLWLNPDQPCVGEARGHVEAFISRTVMSDLMKRSPEVRFAMPCCAVVWGVRQSLER